MTIKRQWEQMLDSAMYSFLDYHYPDDWTEEQWDETLKELIAEVKGGIEDKWLAIRETRRLQDFADAGHLDPERVQEEADVRREALA